MLYGFLLNASRTSLAPETSLKVEEFYNSELEKLLPKELQNKLAKLKKIFKEKKKLPSNLEKEGEEIEQAMMRLEEKGEGIKILHKCYQQAEQYGMKYHNKFTNL